MTALPSGAGSHVRNAQKAKDRAGSSRSEVKLAELSDKLIASMYPDKAFGEPYVSADSSVTSLCFDDRGDTLISAGSDEKIQIFSLSSGRQSKTHYSKKYGVDLVRFTHRSGAIIHASTKLDHAIRHHSLHDNKYLRYFQGHIARVTSLQMSPIDETFLSAAVDDSVRSWDLRAANAQSCLVINGHPLAAYDPSGLVFALSFNESNKVLLYDMRRWAERPFSTFEVVFQSSSVITSLAFSPTGSMLLVGTSGDAHYVLNAYDGTTLFCLSGRAPLSMQDMKGIAEQEPQQSPMLSEAGIGGQECGWTPDGRRVYSGSASHDVLFWVLPEQPAGDARQGHVAAQTLQPSITLNSHPGKGLRTVVFNPRSAMMATAGDHVALWLPDRDAIA